MATWLVGHTPWLIPIRARLRLDLVPPRLWLQARSHLSITLQAPSPASLEIETLPYPTAHPDASVFEPMSQEYASVNTPGADSFTPLSSCDALASLVSKGDFRAAESLRKEMISHHIPIPHDILYLRAALHAIKERRPRGSAKERLEAFETWLSLVPDRSEHWHSFYDIRQRLFWSMDHLNLNLVYRFGLVLASKGYYSGNAAMQVVSTLARYAPLPVAEKYLREIEDISQDYHMEKGTVPPLDLLVGAYSLSIRTVALAGKGEAALGLISTAHSRGIHVSDFTLNIAANHTPDRHKATDQIRALYPAWTVQAHPVSVECESTPTADTEPTHLRSLSTALHTLRLMSSNQALGCTRALPILRSLAYRHSPKSASTWALAEMLHHRSRREPIHLLSVFAHHFHLVGVPRKTLLWLTKGPQGKQVRKEHGRRWGVPPSPMRERLWPSASHTALAWDAIVWLSREPEKERLYALLLSLVRQSRRPEQGPELDASDARQASDVDRPRLQLPPDTYDAAHFSGFVSSWARGAPVRAARVLQDMVELGIEPSVIQWSMLARGYAQHGDPDVALNILDRLFERANDNVQRAEGRRNPSDALLGAHTNVLRGFVMAGDVEHAREVEARLVDRFGYRDGNRPATDAAIALLEGLEARLRS